MDFNLIKEPRMAFVMTPELRLSIQLLKYTNVELINYIWEQVAENPLLNIKEDTFIQKRITTTNQDFWNKNSTSLINFCEDQLGEIKLDHIIRHVCQYLIGNLDERGYLDLDDTFVCKYLRITKDQFNHSLKILHSLDPPGVGARSLAECIEMQLLRKVPLPSLAIQITRQYLNDVANGRLEKIAQDLLVGVDDIQTAVDYIKKCNPRPGASFNSGYYYNNYVYPDIIVKKTGSTYEIILNDKHIPRLVIDSTYMRISNKSVFNHWLRSAYLLLNGLEQRKQTILRVVEAVLRRQHNFLDNGIDGLEPLTLRQIAEELGFHESTISRVTQQKYIQTPKGMFPFRFFFSSKLITNKGKGLSSKIVKDKIKRMIAEENKTKPLSDQKISDQLQYEGIQISRRTVTKYRKDLGIISSTMRREIGLPKLK